MMLTPWQSLERYPLLSLRGEIDRLFDGFMNDGMFKEFKGKGFLPAADMKETETALVVEVDLPGMKAGDVEVKVENGELRIKAEHKEEKDEKTKTFHRSERYHGSIERRLSLPAVVEADKVEASYQDGVLTVTLPKKAGAKAKSVVVKPR